MAATISSAAVAPDVVAPKIVQRLALRRQRGRREQRRRQRRAATSPTLRKLVSRDEIMDMDGTLARLGQQPKLVGDPAAQLASERFVAARAQQRRERSQELDSTTVLRNRLGVKALDRELGDKVHVRLGQVHAHELRGARERRERLRGRRVA